MSGGSGRSCVLSWILSDLEALVTGKLEVTYVFESVGVGVGVVLEEVARHCLILDFLPVVLHFVLVWKRRVSEEPVYQ